MFEILLSSAISIILTAVSILFTVWYSTKFHIKKSNKAREKYMVLEKISHGTKSGFIDSARIFLEKSSIENASGFMDISLTTSNEDIIIDRSAFIHSCIHNVIAPGKIILHKNKTSKEKIKTNGFADFEILSQKSDTNELDLVPKNLLKNMKEIRTVDQKFIYPDNYIGPRYKSRKFIFAKGIGLIYVQTVYINENVDKYVLKKYKVRKKSTRWIPFETLGNYWVYDISYETGPNKFTMNE